MQMTDEQLLTAAIAIIIPISALIYSNSRISDAREALSKQMETTRESLLKQMDALRVEMLAEIRLLRTEMNAGFREVKKDLQIHVLEHHQG